MKNNLIAVFTILTIGLMGQGNSPFSIHGPGDVFGTNFNNNFSLAGIGASTSYTNQVNPLNPASYSDIKFTIGEVGVFSSTNKYQLNAVSDIKNHTNLSGFTLGFPLKNNWGMAFGINPYSKQNYNYFVSDQLADLSTVQYVYEGNGGISNVFLGTGYKYKGISLGVNGTFLFGRLEEISKVKYSNNEFKSVRFQDFSNVKGFGFNSGIQYETTLNEELFLKAGANFTLQSDFNTSNYTKSNYFIVTETLNTNNETITAEFHETDYITNTENVPSEGILILPQNMQAGFTVGEKDYWTLSAEFAFSEWENFSLNSSRNHLKNSQKFMLGGSIIPNIQALGKENYWKSIKYNFGLKYGLSEIVYNNDQLPEYGINLGLSLPLRKFKYETETFGSMVNLSVGYMHRGNGSSSSINEDYINLNLSITLNDKWFIKRKLN
jgi:hypothetical protein